MLLSDAEILRAIEEGELEIAPFDERNLTPNGYDLTVEAVLLPSSGEEVRKGVARVAPMSWFVVGTRERVRLGKKLAAQLWLRSGYARRGVLASFGKVDAGFAGNLTVSAFNASSAELELPIGERFCQLVVERLGTPAMKDYSERSGRFQNQKGITLEPRPPKGAHRAFGEEAGNGLTSRSGSERAERRHGGIHKSGATLKRPAEETQRDSRTGCAAPEPEGNGSICLALECSRCCEGTEMPLTSGDIERIEALGFRREDFIISTKGWTRLRNVNGACFFLRGGICSIYPHRPEGCRLYPVVLDVETREAVLDPECPSRDCFRITPERRKRLLSLARRLAPVPRLETGGRWKVHESSCADSEETRTPRTSATMER
ncbi:MAG: dCTP deaminase [Thermoplasmata archaeon]